VTLVYCGQTVGWIKLKLFVDVGLGPGYIVLDGDPAPRPKKKYSPNFRPMLLWPNGLIDQDATWHTDLGLGSGHIVLDGDPALSPYRDTVPSFRPMSIVV